MFSKTILLSLLPAFLASAAPLDTRETYGATSFGVIAARSTSPIHLQTINATGRGLYIGLPASTYCPSEVEGLDCSGFSNNTLLACASSDGTAGTCGLATSVPGGQSLFVDPKTGEVGYTGAHSAQMPEGAIQTGFEYKSDNGGGSGLGSFSFDKGLVACPRPEKGEGVYQVLGAVEGVDTSGCLGFSGVTSPSSETAWQYS